MGDKMGASKIKMKKKEVDRKYLRTPFHTASSPPLSLNKPPPETLENAFSAGVSRLLRKTKSYLHIFASSCAGFVERSPQTNPLHTIFPMAVTKRTTSEESEKA